MIKNVTIFGGSRPRPGEPAYLEAYHLGELLAMAGLTVITGGYIGTMEAASRGAAERGGHVIGITCEEIESWRPAKHNAWVKEERRFATLRERLFALIDTSDAAIALPGGPGTLAEMAVMWNHLLIDAIAPRPLILIGVGWEQTIETFFKNFDEYIPVEQRRWLLFAPDPEAAVDLIINYPAVKIFGNEDQPG